MAKLWWVHATCKDPTGNGDIMVLFSYRDHDEAWHHYDAMKTCGTDGYIIGLSSHAATRAEVEHAVSLTGRTCDFREPSRS
mgnify:CR=1 FL=1